MMHYRFPPPAKTLLDNGLLHRMDPTPRIDNWRVVTVVAVVHALVAWGVAIWG